MGILLSREFALFLVLTALLAAVVLSLQWEEVVHSLHSLMSHSYERWNARTIYASIRAGECKPIIYQCTYNTYALCPLSDGSFAGLVLGSSDGRMVIITGFQASRKYWQKKLEHNQCFQAR